eukprot:COSAG01_NODE_8548_length_2746_cov_3.096713_3_plen_153_part_00
MWGSQTVANLNGVRCERTNAEILKKFLRLWKVRVAQFHLCRAQRDKVQKEAARLQREGAVEKLMHDTLYLPATTKLTVASMTEFIRVHKDTLQKLDPVLFKARGSGKPHLVSYLNDIIEGKLEPPNGWIRKALAIEAPPAPMLAIADGTVGS